MLEHMRRLALNHLWLGAGDADAAGPEAWYTSVRESDAAKLFPYLVEAADDGGESAAKYFTLGPDADEPDVAVLRQSEFKEGDAGKLPFSQPSGSQSAALGPLIKRSAPSKTKAAGPSEKIVQTTLKAFAEIGDSGEPWADYFRDAHECWSRPKLRAGDDTIDAANGAILAAIERIDAKKTVLLAYRDASGRLPGEVPEYADYLQGVLAATKYATGSVPAVENQTCGLCGAAGVTVYPNALRGAGLNLANLDRVGAFAGLDAATAWQSFGSCVACADLLYVFWFHFSAKYRGRVAGERALVVPAMPPGGGDFKRLAKLFGEWVIAADPPKQKDAIAVHEKQLLRRLSEGDRVFTSLTILWATFGQRLEDVRAVVTDVLPSRLSVLAEVNSEFNKLEGPLMPEIKLNEFHYEVSLDLLWPLLRRPGGKAAQNANESRRLFDLKKDLAEAVYRGDAVLFPGKRFWAEVHETARWHWAEAVESDQPTYLLLKEGWSEKKKVKFLTVAGWVKELTRFLLFLKRIEVYDMGAEQPYEPQYEGLKPYFGGGTAIRGRAEAFAFILGTLYGKLLQVQAARGVNVGANALTWLKRLTLDGKELKELYNRVRHKMLEYERDRKFKRGPRVRAVEAELTELNAVLDGELHKLNEVDTCYHLLLGQAVALKVMPSKPKEPKEAAK